MTGPARKASRPSRIDRIRWVAFGALFLERAWALILSLACLAAIFLVLAWFGVFASIPFVGRVVILAVLAALAVWSIGANRHLRLPARTEVDARIELASRLEHQPLRTQADHASSTDPFAQALWREHQRRMSERLGALSGGSLQTRTERLDPYGARAVVALLFVTAFAYSFGPGGGRIADALAPGEGGIDAVTARLDAWVAPPTYTGRAPIFLSGAGVSNAVAEERGAVTVPVGSVLTVRISDGTEAELSFRPASEGAEAQSIPPVGEESGAKEDSASAADDAAQPAEAAGASAEPQADGTAEETPGTPAGPREYAFKLQEDGSAELASTFSTLGEWEFIVIPDTPPSIAFAGEPSEARNGALQLAYTMGDDYRVRKATAEMVVEDDVVAPDARPLVAPPEIDLAIPRRSRSSDEGEAPQGRTNADLTESPYAGATVAMTLLATDDTGQVGRSQEKMITLPERRFSNPLARAVIEQRRMLALDANTADRVVELLDAVTLRGEEFIEDPGDYLALRAARSRIAHAYEDEQLVSAVDFMWEIALGIEDGNLSLAERRLRDAREQLSEALENGASDEEIEQLMEELREAMREYVQALAEAMRDQPPMDPNQMQMGDMQELSPQDLERMMDQIEDLAKSGSKDAAQQLLSELQQMMDNLQAMRPGQQQQGQPSPMQEQMNKMGELLQRQQELMDQTFDLGRQRIQQEEAQRRERQSGQQQGQPQQGQPQEGQQGQQGQSGEPMTAEELQQMMEDLQAAQGQLQQDLQEMQEAMEGMGMEPAEGLGEAGEAMGNAEGALGEGDDGTAVGEQGRALEAMRRGAQDMMQQMQQAMEEGQGGGQGGQGRSGPGFNGSQQQSGRDPLGRQRQTQGPQFGQDVGVPDEIDTQRAREILDAIRERLGDKLSPQLEREYLERLLKTP